MNVVEAKKDLAIKTKRGLPIILAGVLFWIVMSIIGFALSEKQVVWVYLIGMGCVFPFGLMIAAILKIDMFAKGNPLGVLAGLIGGINVLNIPLVLLAYFQFPEWLPFVVAMLIGVHFIPYVWIYESKSYALLSVTAVYLLTFISLLIENKKADHYQQKSA
ncbi:hypothetical protein [Bacillus sp. L27]|uniref:DUF7010 family protein n=1 Tax=Bacillus sp. L27 TaxID=1866312 RepID=UPI0008FE65DA|nr:hypothetical protein [Bacillus sp. L27]OJD43215.1 hypothetical protein BAU24_24025 [Bacillus sp. L27]